MGSERCIVEISSSDEESSDEEDSGILLFKEVSHKRSMASSHSNGDDEVLVVEKLQCPEGRRMDKSISVFLEKFPRKTGDDDCCILDHDPERSVTALQSNDTEDLVVIGASGPVACRDYPHARHLCAKFPFESTPHESFCEQCHCYVCDVLAPCLSWGQGKQTSDHCHAFDKDEKWKIMRNLKKPVSLLPVTPISSAAPLRPGRSRNQPTSMEIASISFGSPVSNVYPDSSFYSGVSSHAPWTSALPETMFSGAVPSIVDSLQVRSANMNHPVRIASHRMRNSKHCSRNATNQGSIATVSGAKRGSPHVTDQSYMVYGNEVPSAITMQGCTTHAYFQKNAQVRLKGQGIARQQTRRMGSVPAKVSDPIASVPGVSVECVRGLSRGASFPMSFSNFSHELSVFRDCPYNGQREREVQMVQGGGRPNMPEIGSIQSTGLVHHFLSDGTVRDESSQERLGRSWEPVDVSQASENSKTSAVIPSQVSESQNAGLESLQNGIPGVEMQGSSDTGQSVQMKTVPGAYQGTYEDPHRKMLDHQTPFDVSPALEEILAQLDCELWADFDIYSL